MRTLACISAIAIVLFVGCIAPSSNPLSQPPAVNPEGPPLTLGVAPGAYRIVAPLGLESALGLAWTGAEALVLGTVNGTTVLAQVKLNGTVSFHEYPASDGFSIVAAVWNGTALWIREEHYNDRFFSVPGPNGMHGDAMETHTFAQYRALRPDGSVAVAGPSFEDAQRGPTLVAESGRLYAVAFWYPEGGATVDDVQANGTETPMGARWPLVDFSALLSSHSFLDQGRYVALDVANRTVDRLAAPAPACLPGISWQQGTVLYWVMQDSEFVTCPLPGRIRAIDLSTGRTRVTERSTTVA